MTRLSRRIAAGLFAVTFAGTAIAAQASNITGAGSTFVYPVLSKWAADYKTMTGDQINYQSIGSGGGIAQIKAGTVDFGATDKPLSPEELAQAGLAQFPVAIGGVVPVVNIQGLKPGQLRLSGPVLADIYDGRIKTWNDPQIARLNPGLHLPSAPITPVHRSDGSGTTFNFTHYLGQVNPGWKASVGEGTSVNWPGGSVGGKGNEGVATYVKQIPNAIGYVEYAYVLQNHMTYTLMRNAAGQFVAPNTASFQAAAATANWAKSKDFFLVMTNAPGAKAYPITASTFVLMYKHPKNPASSAAARTFFRWALEKGQKQALSLDYVPLPGPLVKHIEAYSAASFK
ncbi:phosphate ABC transporter substrate-binding protein PstS [Novosphingobium profundi]|uniref:phosphate ABC transporter substrate-binding protein PstS n=1 Tax=Novosphingobium profundi TaxID=1774954 RepID=UPI001BD93A46|nr:phosphate ABC transporter substrate-binding protein PstS [Novosphingobium profundi]MBT0670180.1 phosphate ABC transporter substrate-binding protein PstS [Novosphingobium profundi]